MCLIQGKILSNTSCVLCKALYVNISLIPIKFQVASVDLSINSFSLSLLFRQRCAEFNITWQWNWITQELLFLCSMTETNTETNNRSVIPCWSVIAMQQRGIVHPAFTISPYFNCVFCLFVCFCSVNTFFPQCQVVHFYPLLNFSRLLYSQFSSISQP